MRWILKNSIGYKMTLAVTVFGLSVSFLGVAILFLINYRDELQAIEHSFDQIRETNIPGITHSLWVMDRQQLQVQIEAILNVPNVARIEIETKDRTVASAGKAEQGQFVKRSFPLSYIYNGKQMTLGAMHVRVSLSNIYSALFAKTYKRLPFEVAEIFFIAGFILYIFRVLVNKKLSAIEKHIIGLHDGSNKGPLSLPPLLYLKGEDELDKVANAINAMSSGLKDAFRKLEDEKERLAVTLRSIGDGVITTDINGIVTLMNKSAEEFTGWTNESATGKHLHEVFNIISEKTREKCEDPVDKVLRTGLVAGLANHTVLIRKNGSEIIIADSAAPIRDRESRVIGIVLVFRDITNEHRMESEMQTIDKLHSLGILAGGIAHDFNNILTAIMGNVSLAKMQIGPGHKAYERLSIAESATHRATNLTQQLLTFAKGGAPVKKPAALDKIIKEAVDFTLSGMNIKCVYHIPAGPWCAEIDSGQIAQVFNNLVINAVQAMTDGGVITIEFKSVYLRGSQGHPLNEGEYAKIVFKDHGSGIPEHHLHKIFDPYFTTKSKGSGLGLASVFSIIRKHEGHIEVESKVGEGTRFIIHLPLSSSSTYTDVDSGQSIASGRGRALVMDDESIVRDVAGQMLSSLGYEVDFAVDGEEAIAKYITADEEKRPYGFVIMDLTVPGGMGGKDAAKRLLEIDGKAKVIVSSGYSNDPVMADYKSYGFKGVIIKPYTLSQASQVVSEVLDRRG